ncbi:hypothetical protein QTO34_005473 [Cnephaeus nilssonii]|uniref:Transmembrane protein 252 n=1 Tax=Cnephaeus nilssonii TaxID=3371016 RepID=A0AA40HPC6_CNENI|nr:hypothetical protein QTO34_005473 [Eptesicus nilssonii]
MRNRTGAVLCALALLTGFLIICLGAFFISSGSTFNCRWNLILAYLLLPLGFVILLSGIFWSTYRQASESKGMFSHVLRPHLAQGPWPQPQWTGIKHQASSLRPDFYPPAYEESLDAGKQTCPAEGEAMDVPPPLYTEMDLGFEVASGAHREAPPSYAESAVDGAVAATTWKDAQRQSPEC